MKYLEFQTRIAVHEQAHTLEDPSEANLLQAALQACDTAYAPYSNFRVGAALLLENGQIVIGSNQENAAYPLTMCAERNALATAAALYPQIKILKIAIRAKTTQGQLSQPVPPCGACRQVLYEGECRHQQDMILLLQAELGPIYRINTVKDLLPLRFDADFL